METIKINGHEYNVSVIPLDMTPYTALYADLAKQKPKDPTEAKQIQEKMKEVIETILDATVKGPREPEWGDDAELFAYIMGLTRSRIQAQQNLFREPQDSRSQESGGTGAPSGNETLGTSASQP